MLTLQGQVLQSMRLAVAALVHREGDCVRQSCGAFQAVHGLLHVITQGLLNACKNT